MKVFNMFQKIILSVSLPMCLLIWQCKPGTKASTDLDGNQLRPVSPPQDYCVTLEKITFEGGLAKYEGDAADADSRLLGPQMYGRVCALSTEDNAIKKEDLDIRDRAVNCKSFFFTQHNEPVDGSFLSLDDLEIILSAYAEDKVESLPPEDLIEMYTSLQPAPRVEIDRLLLDFDEGKVKGEYAALVNTRHTIRLKDRRNHRILFIFLPVFENSDGFCDGPHDPVFMSEITTDGFSYGEGKSPGKAEVLDRHFAKRPFSPVYRKFRLSKSNICLKNSLLSFFLGTPAAATFHFKIERKACASEQPIANSIHIPTEEGGGENENQSPANNGNPAASPVAGNSPSQGFSYNHLAQPNKYCVKLSSANKSTPQGRNWDVAFSGGASGGNIESQPELYGRVCATTADDIALAAKNSELSAATSATKASQILKTKLQNCQNLWFEKNSARLGARARILEMSFANIISSLSSSIETSVSNFYLQDEGSTAAVTVGTANENSDVMLIFAPIIDADIFPDSEATGDDVLEPGSFASNSPYPVVLRIPASDIPASGSITKQAGFSFSSGASEGGNLDFNFEISRGVCP